MCRAREGLGLPPARHRPALARQHRHLVSPPLPPSRWTARASSPRFGGVFEHSPWIAEAAWDAGLPADADTADGLHRGAVRGPSRRPPAGRKLALLQAHPDLAGKLAAGRPADREVDQRAGLGRARPADRRGAARLLPQLNDAYQAKFGFPVHHRRQGPEQGRDPGGFPERRTATTVTTELATALAQVERIALLRLKDMLP